MLSTHQIDADPVPWSYTFSTVYPSVSANIKVQGNGDQIGCRITVDGVVQRENKSDGVQTCSWGWLRLRGADRHQAGARCRAESTGSWAA
jgi:Mycobacterium membrane protein